MKTTIVAAVACLSLFAGVAAVAAPVHDWHDLEEVHRHVLEGIHEMERVSAANHYDMAGHAAKAEQLMRAAERELHEAIEARRMMR